MDKATLRQYISIVKEIEQLETERETILARLQGAVQYDGMPHSRDVADPVGNTVAKLGELKTLLDKKLDELADLRFAIENAVAELPSEERRLMRLRYIEGKTWEQVGVEMCYDYRHVLRLHGQILLKLKDVTKCHLLRCYNRTMEG